MENRRIQLIFCVASLVMTACRPPASSYVSPILLFNGTGTSPNDGWGGVVAKYPDGTPAIVEGASGRGWVILSGVHPEAPATWRQGMTCTTPAKEDNAYAVKLIDAALNRTLLPHY